MNAATLNRLQRRYEGRTPIFRFPAVRYSTLPEDLIYDGSNRCIAQYDKSGNSSVNAFIAGVGTGNIAYLTTGTAVGTGDFTVVQKFTVPPTAPAAGNPAVSFASAIAGSSAANSLIFDLNPSYNVVVGLYAAVSNFRYNTYGALLASYVGQTVTLTLTRSGATWTLYLNGVAQTPTATNTTGGGAPPAFTDTVNSTYTIFGTASTANANTVANFPIYEGRAYSAALDAAGVLADYNGTVQANNIVNVNFGLMAKLATAPVATSGQTLTVTSSGATGARISGARDLVQMTAANQPILTIAAGGNFLTYNGTTMFSKAAAFALAQPTTVYFVGQQVTWTLNDTFYDGNSINNRMSVYQSDVTPRLRMNGGTAFLADNGNLPVATNGVITAVYNNTESQLRINRTAASVGTAGTHNANGFMLGAYSAGPANFANITASEVLVYAENHDEIAQQRMARDQMRQRRMPMAA